MRIIILLNNGIIIQILFIWHIPNMHPSPYLYKPYIITNIKYYFIPLSYECVHYHTLITKLHTYYFCHLLLSPYNYIYPVFLLFSYSLTKFIIKVSLLTCEHTFHVKCIDEWLRKGKTNCPLCQKKVFNYLNIINS